MTYCVGVLLDRGFVLASDSRTNAGVDDIATFRKMTIFEKPGTHLIAMVAAGNLSLTQSVVSLLGEWANNGEPELDLNQTKTMYRVAHLVGRAVNEVHRLEAEALASQSIEFNPTFVIGGQIGNERPRLFHVYSAGNFIEASPDTPFFQIGEIKYGKPVFDRLLKSSMPLAEAAKLILISFDSTMRSNLSVGLPIDLLCYEADSLRVTHLRRLTDADGYMAGVRKQWGEGLRRVFETVPPPGLDG